MEYGDERNRKKMTQIESFTFPILFSHLLIYSYLDKNARNTKKKPLDDQSRVFKGAREHLEDFIREKR